MEIEDIKSINLKPGDSLLVELQKTALDSELDVMSEFLDRNYPGVKYIVFRKGEFKLTKLTQDNEVVEPK